MINEDDFRDAVAWLRATHRVDSEGRNAIARNCDPTNMLDVLTLMHLRVLDLAYPNDIEDHFNFLLEHVDDFVNSIGYLGGTK